MNRKAISGIVLTLVLVGILTLTSNVQLLKARGTIYIREDGSIDPDDERIITEDLVHYYFVDDIYDNLVIKRSNITINGAGYTLEGTGRDYGVDIDNSDPLYAVENVTIKNMKIHRFYIGILITSSQNCSIFGNTITDCNEWGIELSGSSENRIYGNYITNSDNGINFEEASNNNFVNGNVIANNHQNGIEIHQLSSNNSIFENNITTNFRYGVIIQGSPNNRIWGNNITGNSGLRNIQSAIEVTNSPNNRIYENKIAFNKDYGLLFENSSNNLVYENEIANNGNDGLFFSHSSYNTVYNNEILNNTHGIVISGSNSISIFGNKIANNTKGIFLGQSNNATIFENNIKANKEIGVSLEFGSYYSTLYHNNFVDNAQQVYIYGSTGVWDDGYPSGGNYWSDYNGSDKCWGEGQTLSGSDMIGDTPYVIIERLPYKDRYPLMERWPMLNCWYFEDNRVMIISDSSIADFGFNKKRGEITFNVAVDKSDFSKLIVSKLLLDGAFNFYIDNLLSVFPVGWSSKFHMINLTYSQGNHSIKIIGEYTSPCTPECPDVNRDGIIDIFDVILVAKCLGKTPEEIWDQQT